jgi:hypothetical protein
VEISKIEVHRAAGPDSEWITIVDQPVAFDLLKITEVQKFLGSQEVPEGTYTQVRFMVTQATVIVDGKEHTASIPSGKLKLIRPFQVAQGETTLVLLDFDGSRSLYITGGGDFKLEPTVKLLVPSTGAAEEDEEEKSEAEETEVEIEGIVVRFSDTELVLLVAGQEIPIPLGTEAEIEGDLEEGSWAKVEAVAKDGSFLAMEIEVEDAEEEIEEEEELAQKIEQADGDTAKIAKAEKEAAQKIREMEEAEGEEGNEEEED